jgi:signal transduction histidine kinase
MTRLAEHAMRLRQTLRTVRARLALLYAGAFLGSGVLLLAIPAGFVHSGSSSSAAVSQEQGGVAPTPGNGIASTQHATDVHNLVIGSVVALAVLVVLSFVLGWVLAGRLLRPLRTITDTAREISASNLHQRLDLTGPDDEFKELGETLDDLFTRLEASFEAQRRFVANASHELRTPLTAERTLLQVALADPDADTHALRVACEQVLTLGAAQERLIDALLTLATSERGIERREIRDLADIAAGLLQDRQPQTQRRQLQVATALAASVVAGDPRLLQILVANLIDNAIQHNVNGGRIELTTATIAGRATLSVHNTGPVIPPQQVSRLLQPFQRLGAERVRQTDGHGLGLAIVQAIATAHGATLTGTARPDGGLDIDVNFPTEPDRPSSRPGAPT